MVGDGGGAVGVGNGSVGATSGVVGSVVGAVGAFCVTVGMGGGLVGCGAVVLELFEVSVGCGENIGTGTGLGNGLLLSSVWRISATSAALSGAMYLLFGGWGSFWWSTC